MAANFWENDEIVAPAAAPAAKTAAPMPGVTSSAPGQSLSASAPPIASASSNAPASMPPAAPAPKAFWEGDEIVKPAPEVTSKTGSAPTGVTTSGEQPKPERSFMGNVGHQLGLTARAAVNAVATVPAMASDAVTGVINSGLDAVAGQGKGFRFQKAMPALNNVMDAAGVAQPENATERVVQDIVTGAGTAATGVGLGAMLARSSGPLSRAAGMMLQAGPGMQVASAATGAGASGITREAGGGEGAQIAAGLAGSLAPTVLPYAAAAAVRGAVRGGSAGRQTMADNIQTFQNAAGSMPTVGQATGSHTLQSVETGLSNVMGGSGIMIRKGERQAEELANSVRQLTDTLTPNASGADAGEAITKGMNVFKDHMKTTQKHLYSELDKHIPDATPIGISRTQQALQDLNADIPGAPNLSEFFKNAKIKGIDQALQSDSAQSSGTMPYEAIKKLRTLVGNEISNNSLVSDVPRSKWRAVYASLSEDLGDAAKQAGPRAEQLWSRANTVTRLSMERMEQLSGIVNRDAPEKVFRAATTGMAEGGTTINRLMKSLPQENRREVAAAVLQRLGRAKPGVQNEMGDAFSSETFLTNLASMSVPARKALFANSGFPGLEEKVQQMGRMASVRRDGSKVFANPSGTARLTGLFSQISALATGLATGNPLAITSALSTPLVANVGAKVMTSPWVVKELARETTLNTATRSSALSATARAAQDSQKDEKKPLNRYQAGRLAFKNGGVVERVEGGFVVNPPMDLPASPPEDKPMNRLQAGVHAHKTGGTVEKVEGGFVVRPATPSTVESEIPSHHQPEGPADDQADKAIEIQPQAPASQADKIADAAHEAATSPHNDLPEPSEAQQQAGNYKVGRLRVAGMDISVENPEGSIRRGTDPDGKPWETQMQGAHYGYVRGTQANDGDKLDVFVKPGTSPDHKGPVFVVDQVDPRTGKFDEHKSVMGAADEKEAEAIYRSNYAPDWKGMGAITRLPMVAFKAWAKSGRLKEPLSS